MDALVHTFFFFLFFFLTNKSQKVTRAEQMQSWCNTIIIHKFTNTSKREKKRKGNKSPNTIPHMTSMHGFTRLLQSDISSFLSHLQKKKPSLVTQFDFFHNTHGMGDMEMRLTCIKKMNNKKTQNKFI